MAEKFASVPYTKELQEQYSLKFDCENEALNAFLRSYDAIDPLLGKTYVIISGDSIFGYYNISTGDIEDENGFCMGGSIYINYLALDKEYHHIMYDENERLYASDFLLGDCFNRVMYLQGNYIGFTFITLSSTDEGYELYKRNGFEELEEDMKFSKNIGEKTCKSMYWAIPMEEE